LCFISISFTGAEKNQLKIADFGGVGKKERNQRKPTKPIKQIDLLFMKRDLHFLKIHDLLDWALFQTSQNDGEKQGHLTSMLSLHKSLTTSSL